MSLLTHPSAKALLDEAVITADQLQTLARRLQPFLQRYLPLFQRDEQRQHATHILQGKLSSVSRKTCEPIAQLFHVRREILQDFVGVSPWDDRLILDALRQHLSTVWADPQGVLIGDGSAFAKKGEHSCGVQRQFCGRLGKVENCQLGIFLGYACRFGQALLEHRLFLPREWAQDATRRAATGVPAKVVYQENWEILLDQLKICRGVPHAWFVADAEFGRVNAFRKALRKLPERYVVDVREDLRLRDLKAPLPARRGVRGRKPQTSPETSAAAWSAAQPSKAWRRFEVRGGEKGPLRVEAIETWVETYEASRIGPVERLAVIRTVGSDEGRTWYVLSNAPESVPLEQLVWAHAQRHWQEANFQEAKSEVGLSHYEVRSWRGWHHHMTLSVLALWFLALEQDEVKKKRQR
jgi:SRSO17 transposase